MCVCVCVCVCVRRVVCGLSIPVCSIGNENLASLHFSHTSFYDSFVVERKKPMGC